MAQQARDPAEIKKHLDRFYELLGRLRHGLCGGRLLRDCNGKMGWPKRGLYFFFEAGEFRHDHPGELRVVRVGTHAVSKGSKTTLWNRLSGHRGYRAGGGNHRGSIFRLHVGAALLARSNGSISVPSWSRGSSAPKEVRQTEADLETVVSRQIGDMPFLWISVDDEASAASRRSYLESNSIGLLTATTPPIDPPSANWLGSFSPVACIRETGLWNIKHIGKVYDPAFLELLEECVKATTAGSSAKPSAVLGTPTQFRAFMGGYVGLSFGIRWENGVLFYDRFDTGYQLSQTSELHPTKTDWANLWKQLEAIEVWSWKKDYLKEGICDGTNWTLEIEVAGRSLKSGGSNAYPPQFKAFCKAVSKLAGGFRFA